jgi:RHS repeat-associated protein
MKKVLSTAILTLALMLPAFAQTTITIYPDKDAELKMSQSILDPRNTTNYGTSTYCEANTFSIRLITTKSKSLIGVDLSSVPEGVLIIEAKLHLYGTGGHLYSSTGDLLHSSNACYLRRVTSSWNESTVTWMTAPSVTTSNQVTLANSTSSDQNYIADVTNLIRDIQANPSTSDGLMLSLVTEEAITNMQFASSDHATSSLHPKLEITYVKSGFPDYESFEFADTKWENVTSDDIDWVRDNDGTPSTYTGPSSASNGKYYAYIEASGYYNKNARLQSPAYNFKDAERAFISFDYHMYGGDMGNLYLQVSTDNGSTWSYPAIWSRSGGQGWDWQHELIDLSSYTGGSDPVLIRFEGVTGSGYKSDMALDNIRVIMSKSVDLTEAENYIISNSLMTEYGADGPQQLNVKYFDGLGRLNQEVSVGNSPGGDDLIKPVEYDDYGRAYRDYLPFTAVDDEGGSFRDYDINGDDVLGMQEDFYQDHFSLGSTDPFAYARTVFEESPLNRVLAKGAPGDDFSPIVETGYGSEHVQEFEYESNTSSEVRCFTVNSSTGALQNSTSFYDANTLNKSTFSDEDGNESEEFKDKLGEVVLKRTFEGSNSLSTYYVYDDYGLLRYVLPPKAVGDNGLPTTTLQDQLCYYYEYDGRNRMIEKKFPGVEPVYMVYDHRDRLVGTQDGELRNSNEWIMTKYDELNRPVISARVGFSSAVSQATIQGYITTFYNNSSNEEYEEYNGTGNGYTDQSYPDLSSAYSNHVLTVTFYDNYDFLSLSQYAGLDFDDTNNIDAYNDEDGTSNGYFDRVSGQVTGGSSMILDGNNDTWVRSATFYDNKYRMIQTQSQLYPQGSVMVSTEYDFLGNVMQALEVQTVNSVTNKVLNLYTYDMANRLLDTYVLYGSDDAILLAQNKYNELGQLKKKNLHSDDNSDFTQAVDYTYNIRGWLTSINDPGSLDDDKFGMELFYQDVSGAPTSTARYNGNISGISWAHNGASVEGYAFTYDELNRLDIGDYKTYSGSSWVASNNFDTDYSYDRNGNITTLSRDNGSGTEIDALTYTYIGNQLDYINDAGTSAGVNNTNASGTDYTYDDNGNMEWDKNKDMKIDYNYLNLPKKIYEESGTGDELLYIYDANGTKWLKKLTDGSTITKTMYAGSFVYEDIDNDAIDDFGLDYILNPEGKIDNLGTSVEYLYHLKDHLGNTRVIFNGGDTIKQKTDYYPFGMTSYQSSSSNDNKYLFNGKELQDELLGSVNLDWYDYGARFYDPALGRWHVPDPLMEEHFNYTPYHYTFNNPILFIDPFGLDTTVYVLDQAANPDNKRTYTADIYVDADGEINGPYKGSSFPNDGDRHNTLDEGEHSYNNASGHHGGDSKGLNIVNEEEDRVADGTAPNGTDQEMTVVNVHSGVRPEDDPAGLGRQNRGSAGCPTVHPSDANTFFTNFDWSGPSGTTGNSTGTLNVQRGAGAKVTKAVLGIMKTTQDLIPTQQSTTVRVPYRN